MHTKETPAGSEEAAIGSGFLIAAAASWLFNYGPVMAAIVGLVFIAWGFLKLYRVQ